MPEQSSSQVQQLVSVILVLLADGLDLGVETGSEVVYEGFEAVEDGDDTGLLGEGGIGISKRFITSGLNRGTLAFLTFDFK